MKFVGVTACAVGMAHTYMAAEAIEKMFKKLGHECKIERDGNLGPENELSVEDLQEADAVIMAVSGSLLDPERFEGYEEKTVALSVQEGLRNPERIIELLREKGLYR